MKKVAIIQARYESTRLPGKILKSLPYGSSETALEQVVKRVSRSKHLNGVVVATTDHAQDDAVAELCQSKGWQYFRGSMDDVLSRYYGAAVMAGADIVVRITSDCPCLDVDIMDDMLSQFDGADYMSNVHPRVFPHGMDAEIFTFASLKTAHEKATEKHDREHVTPYIINGDFKRKTYSPKVSGGADIRITLDRREDYALLCAVYDNLYADNEFFGYAEIIELFEQKPWLKMINENVIQKKKYESVSEEIDDAVKMLRMQELFNASKVLEENR